MTVISHRIRLVLNNKQKSFLHRCFGTSRWVYNQSISLNEKMYAEGVKFPGKYDYRNIFIKEIKQNSEYSWLYAVPKSIIEYAIFDYHDAMKRFLKGKAKYPKYHKKNKRKDSFTLGNDKLNIDGKKVRIPIIGWMKMREELRFKGKIQNVTVSRSANQYYISFSVETQIHALPHTGSMIGVDLNVKSIVDSNGDYYVQPRSLGKNLLKLKSLSRAYSRTQRGSKNRQKAKLRLARLHLRISHQRSDTHHKISSSMIRDNSFIFTESLNVTGMMKNKKLARVISDSGFGEFLRQLQYKAGNHDRALVPIGQYYPSSKTCSACGAVKTKLSLSERVFMCDCGSILDRDENAALNILQEGIKLLYSKEPDRGLHGSNACGEESSGHSSNTMTKLSSKKQELTFKLNQV